MTSYMMPCTSELYTHGTIFLVNDLVKNWLFRLRKSGQPYRGKTMVQLQSPLLSSAADAAAIPNPPPAASDDDAASLPPAASAPKGNAPSTPTYIAAEAVVKESQQFLHRSRHCPLHLPPCPILLLHQAPSSFCTQPPLSHLWPLLLEGFKRPRSKSRRDSPGRPQY